MREALEGGRGGKEVQKVGGVGSRNGDFYASKRRTRKGRLKGIKERLCLFLSWKPQNTLDMLFNHQDILVTEELLAFN